MGDTGTPRWSPDSRRIAFDGGWRDHGAIFSVDVDGLPRQLVADDYNNLVPSFSRDGKWVYFASDRSGTWQVWKVPSEGGDQVQVTAHSGFAAYESYDGLTLYYSKHNMPNPEIWSMPVKGGNEDRLSALMRPETWANWAPTERGIFFIELDSARRPEVKFFDFAAKKASRVATLDKLPFWLSASPDGTSVFYEHLDQENSHVMLLENFR
jgi:Tol biopolymer transport system component